MNRKAEIGTIIIALFILSIGGLLLINNPTITGNAIAPNTPDFCGNTPESCIDLNGDKQITLEDEDIFARLLNDTQYGIDNPHLIPLTDFDGDGDVDQIDFQQCFVPIRDYFVDNNLTVECSSNPDNLTNRTDKEGCTNGCADLNGDGYVDDQDYILLNMVMTNTTNQSNYPMADLTGDNKYNIEDKFCFTAYLGDIVMCNIPRHKIHTVRCPDLTNVSGNDNDGIINEHDNTLFYQYKETQNLKADFNDDGYVDWLDKYIFDQYYRNGESRIIDCNLYHAPWHVGGVDQSNSNISTTTSNDLGDTNNLSQEFTTAREGQLTKIRFYMTNTTTGPYNDIKVKIYPDAGGSPNWSIIIPPEATIEKFDRSEAHWETAYFRQPPSLKNNTKYHIVVTATDSGSTAYQWFYDGTSNIFEVFTSTACADFNGDGIVGQPDRDIIDRIPDGISAGGSSTWNETYDVNEDHVVNQTDHNLVFNAYDSAGGFALKPELYQSYDVAGNAPKSFGSTKWLAQPFIANDSRISIVELLLKSAATAKREIFVEVWSSDQIPYPLNTSFNITVPYERVEYTTITGFLNTNFEWYNATFSDAIELETGKTYFVVLDSPVSTTQLAYQWSDSTTATGNLVITTNGGNPSTVWTNTSGNKVMAYKLYNGHPQYNQSYDVNNDSLVDAEDTDLIGLILPSWDGSFWTPLFDFNAIFGVYESLRDRILGFDAYMGKILACGLPTWTISDGDGRCDYEYENYSTTLDCPNCNNDGFCAVTEDFDSCPNDCTLPPAIPHYFSFNGSTTDFENYSDLSNVVGAVLERWPYGKIEFLEPLNLESNYSLEFDEYVTIEQNNITINITALPQLNKSARITLYNLNKTWPRILENGIVCEGLTCTYENYKIIPNNTLIFTITGWENSITEFSTREDGPSYSDYIVGTTNFHRSFISDIENVVGVIINKPQIGKIEFTETINASQVDINSNVKINYANITVNSTTEPKLNKTASITMYNLSMVYPIILRDGTECEGDKCDYLNFVNNDLRFLTYEFTSYTAVDAAPNVTGFNGTTTNFIRGVLNDIYNVENMILEVQDKGKIRFLETINASYGNYSTDIEISLNYGAGGWVGGSVNSTADPRLNKSAEITLYDLSLHTPRIIFENESTCPANICEVVSYGTNCNNSCDLIFNVTHFTKYQAVENTTSPQAINSPIPILIWNESSNYTINISYYFFDVDNETLIYDTEISTTNVNSTINGDIITLESVGGWSGLGKINFTASDGNNSHQNATHGPILFIVLQNKPPQTNGTIENKLWDEDTNISIELNNYFTDPDEDILTYDYKCTGINCIGKNITNITLEINGSQAKLIPDENWNSEYRNWEGKRHVYFIAKDYEYNITSNIVELEVNSINDIPIQNKTIEDIIINEDNNYTLQLAEYFEDVEDYDNEMSYELVNTPTKFNVTINQSNTSIYFEPNENWYGLEEFTLKITDTNNASIISNTFNIFVLSEEDDLIRTNLTFDLTWYEDHDLKINLSDYYLDVDNQVIYFAELDSFPNPNMTILIDHMSGYVRFLPAENYFGVLPINLSAEDITSEIWEYVNLTIINLNDLPILNLSALTYYQIKEDSVNDSINLSLYVDDSDNADINWSCKGNENITAFADNTTKKLTLIGQNNYTGITEVECKICDICSNYINERWEIEEEGEAIWTDENSYLTRIINGNIETIKYDEDGNEVWRVIENLTEPVKINTITLDDYGNVYVGGSIDIVGKNIFVIKYYPNGTKKYDINDGTFGEIKDMVVDDNQNIYLITQIGNFTEILKYDIHGSQEWTATDLGKAKAIKLFEEIIYVAWNNNGSAIITKLPPDLQYAWSESYQNISAEDIAIIEGKVFLLGNLNDTGRLLLINETGEEQWRKEIGIKVTKLDKDNMGNVYVIGNNGTDTVILKFNGAGINIENKTIINYTAKDISIKERDMAITGERTYKYEIPMFVEDSFYVNLTPVNDAPLVDFSQIDNMTLQGNTIINLSNYVYDIDNEKSEINWSCINYNGNLTINVSGELLSIFAITNSVDKNVTCNATDPEGLIGTDTFTIKLFVNSTFIESYVEGIYYNGSYGNVTGVFESLMNNSNATNSNITLSDLQNSNTENSNIILSDLNNSNVINSTLDNCTIINSIVENTICIDTIIDPSITRNSDATGSWVENTEVYDSNATYSTMRNSTIDKSDVNNSVVLDTKNCKIFKTKLRDAHIVNCRITNGDIYYRNGTLYDAGISGAKNLTDIINYEPQANFGWTPNKLVITFTDLSSDENIGTELNDTLTYLWLFGDGSNATTASPSNTYASAGNYNVNLTVRDNENQTSTSIKTVTASIPKTGGGGGGGGGGSSSSTGGCAPIWTCDEWTKCINGQKTRNCNDLNNCNLPEGKPFEIESCEITVCVEEWECSAWNTCTTAGRQTKICNDKNNCGTTEQKPIIQQTCEYIGTCNDRIRNQGETGIDCGGPCDSCQEPIEEQPEQSSKTGLYLLLGFLILGILLGVGYLFYDKYLIEQTLGTTKPIKPIIKQPKTIITPPNKDVRLKKYVEMTLEAGFPKQRIIKRLKQEGWNDKQIERAFK